MGSTGISCDQNGLCLCKPGFTGNKCETSCKVSKSKAWKAKSRNSFNIVIPFTQLNWLCSLYNKQTSFSTVYRILNLKLTILNQEMKSSKKRIKSCKLNWKVVKTLIAGLIFNVMGKEQPIAVALRDACASLAGGKADVTSAKWQMFI